MRAFQKQLVSEGLINIKETPELIIFPRGKPIGDNIQTVINLNVIDVNSKQKHKRK